MGYTTEFRGSFTLTPPLTSEQRIALQDFADKRHGNDAPSYYCQWVPTKNGAGLEWDGGEKFYEYEEWLKVLDDRFFKKWDVRLSGTVYFVGEDDSDRGTLSFVDGRVVKGDGDK